MSPSARSVLIVGVGNPDRGDDGIGPAVARRLDGRVGAGVKVLELGGDALALIAGWEGFASVIVVDAAAPMTTPGRTHRIDLVEDPLPIGLAAPSSHVFGLAETVELARSLGRLPLSLVAYLVEGRQFNSGAPLSPPVAEAVDEVAKRILADIALPSKECTGRA